MKKILLALDALHADKNTITFACYLGGLTKSAITGIFLENLVVEQKPVLKHMHGMTYVNWEIDENSDLHKSRMKQVEDSIKIFKEICFNEGVSYTIHRDSGVPARDLISESRFADMLIIDAETSFNKRDERAPTEFVRDVLHKAECPVIIAPENFENIHELVFAYNGSASSVFAIKQFTYLFPQMNVHKATVIQVNEEGRWEDNDTFRFKEWLNDHYTNLHFEVLKGASGSLLFEYLFKRKNSILIMGAYGRNALSEFFNHSYADLIIKTVTQPIFIAHL